MSAAVKPGNCPFNAGYSGIYNTNNGYNGYSGGIRYKREEAPLSSRFYTGGIYNNNDAYSGYSGYNGYNGVGNTNGYQRDECYSDNDCVGRQKCCQNFGYRQCANPLYSG